MRRINCNGVELAVLDEGEGEAVLLVHGFPDDHRIWRKLVPDLLAAGFRVLAPDMRGCGQSAMPNLVSDYRLAALVDDLARLLEALGIERVRLVGHDWGAMIAWHFCLTHPGRIERFVALSVGHPAAYTRAPLTQKLMQWYILMFQFRGIAEWLLRARNWQVLRKLTGFPCEAGHWIANLSRPGRLTAALNYYRANLALVLPSKIARVKVPVLGVWSDRDRFLCRQQMQNSERYASAGFRFVEIAGVGHWLPLEAPDQVNPLVLDFFARNTA